MRDVLPKKRPERMDNTFATSIEAIVKSALKDAKIKPVESYRKKEKPLARLRRYADTIILGGKNATMGNGRRVLNSHKPDKYDRRGYEDHLGDVVGRIVDENDEMPAAMYDIAGDVSRHINEQNNHQRKSYRFYRDDSEGVEALSILRSIVHNPKFIEGEQAAMVLANLGPVSYEVCYDLFTHSEPRGVNLDINEGYSTDSIAHFERIADSDELWQKADYNTDERQEAQWPLASVAKALGVLSRKYPSETFDARVNMLKRNEVAQASGMIDQYLVYTFVCREEKAALEEVAARDTKEGIDSQVVPNILSGRYLNTAWAT